jgi:peptidoglycan/xylan/chitin deacetylase (PgdA/CDA1 family)
MLLFFPVMAQSAKLDKPIFALTADDGYASQYDYFFPILVAHRLTATFYIPTKYIGSAGYMTREQTWIIYWYGARIDNHSLNHMDFTGKSYKKIFREIQGAQTEFLSMGFDARTFAYPFGVMTPRVVKAFKAAGLIAGRGAWAEKDMFNFPDTFDLSWIECIPLAEVTFEEIKPLIDTAVEMGGGTCFVVHETFPGATGPYTIDSIELEKIAAYIEQLRDAGLVDVETIDRMVSKLIHYKNLP